MPTSDVVASIPWEAEEELHYVLLDSSGEPTATGVHTIETQGDRTTLTTRYENPNGDSDTTAVVVDAVTLKPMSSVRDIVSAGSDDEHVEVEYTDEGALIRVGEGDRQSGLSVGEHSYDNDTSLFLWRTIAFAEDYEASYTTVITNQRNDQQVILRVAGKETVTVPAGQFEAWRLEIITSNARQTAWYADSPGRPLVRYDNSIGTTWELTSQP